MLNNIKIGKFYPSISKIHNMHPLAKIVCIFIFVLCTLMVTDPVILCCLGLLLLLMMLASNLPLLIYMKSIWGLKWFFLLLVLLNLLFSVPFITVFILVIKIFYMVLATSILTATTTPVDMTHGLTLFLKPLSWFSIPVESLAFSLSLALRFIPVIVIQGDKILKSQASRGMDYTHTSLKGKLLAIKSMIIPMFVLSLRRSDQLADAMEVRLYQPQKKRNSYRVNKWGGFDTYFVFVHVSILIFMIVKGVVQ